MTSEHCDYDDLGDLGLQGGQIPELPTLPFADLPMSIEDGVGIPQVNAWEGQRPAGTVMAAAVGPNDYHHNKHGLSGAAGPAPTTVKTEWSTPPTSVSPQFSVASSPERDSSDSDEGGCTTPPHQLPKNTASSTVGEPRASAKRKAAPPPAQDDEPSTLVKPKKKPRKGRCDRYRFAR